MMREVLHRLIDMFRRSTLERELREELEFHQQQLERQVEEEHASGSAVGRQARLRLGSTVRITEDARDRWSWPWIDHMVQDARFAMRGLRRTPVFTVVVMVTLALGVGANAVMFGVVDRLMFRPLDHLRDPGTVHRVYLQTTSRGRVETEVTMPYERYRDFERDSTAFSQVAGINERTMAIGAGDGLREVRVGGVTASYFDLFDAPPVAGRYFGPHEDVAPFGSPVVVLTHSFWNSAYGGRAVIGETLVVGDLATTIVGVAPKGLAGLDDGEPVQLFLPLTAFGPALGGTAATRFSSGYDFFWGAMLVRRKPGVSVAAATTDVTRVFEASWEKQRELAPPGVPPLRPANEALPRAEVGAVRRGGGPARSLDARTATWVAGVAVVLLLIAVANVGSLLLLRTLQRRHETAVRLALGVSRGRLAAHLMAESVVLACGGALGAMAVTGAVGPAVFALLSATRGGDVQLLDGRVVAIIGLTTAVVALVIALIPVWVLFRLWRVKSVRDEGRGLGAGGRVRTTLVLTQAALSLVLIVGALLFVRSLSAVRSLPLGYDQERIVMVNRVMRGRPLSPEAQRSLRETLLTTAQQHPSVEAATWRSSTPLGQAMALRLAIDGIEDPASLGFFSAQIADGDYFTVMGTRIVKGRAWTRQHRSDVRVAVVSESMANLLWPGSDPLGQCLRIGGAASPCTSVIGVAEDIVANSLTDRERLQYYLPLEQTEGFGGGGMFARVRGDTTTAAASLQRTLQAVMPGTSYVTASPMVSLLVRPQRSWRLGATIFTAFGALALVVAAVGLFAVVSSGIAQRRREVGLRMALGATSRQIAWMVLRQGLGMTAGGVTVGIALALAFSGRLQPLLFAQSARDPWVYAVAAASLLLVAVLATLLPAVRAVRISPATSLRGES